MSAGRRVPEICAASEPVLTSLQSYEDVKVTDEGVDTADFCEASENLVRIFGRSSTSSAQYSS